MENPLPIDSSILVVDDDLMSTRLLSVVLGNRGYQIDTADGGMAALERIKENPPDIILLDVVMPEMDGFETLKRIKSTTTGRDIPVIFMTALSKPADKIRGLQEGAVDYITKPINADEVIARVDTHMSLRKLQKDLEFKNKRLVVLDQEKNDFLGMVAHDLKNPLSVIQGFSAVIQESLDHGSNEVICGYLKIIERNSVRMFTLIDDLLNVNTIESGTVKITNEIVDIAAVVNEVIETNSESARSKGIVLTFEGSAGDASIVANRQAIIQVMDNLVSNALKFTPLCKKVSIRAITGANGYLKCEIEDEGPGISDDDQKKLFGKFQRLSARPTANESSTGLGLYIVKKLVEQMNGRISCTSTLGKGAKFAIEFPVAKTE